MDKYKMISRNGEQKLKVNIGRKRHSTFSFPEANKYPVKEWALMN